MTRSPPVTKRSSQRPQPHKVLADFLPAVRQWFTRTFDAPAPAQIKAWPTIRKGHNTLLLAPTGSGKTLAAFLSVIDDLLRRAQADDLTDAVHVLYITPLKALGNDIHRNLLAPLEGIRKASRGRLIGTLQPTQCRRRRQGIIPG